MLVAAPLLAWLLRDAIGYRGQALAATVTLLAFVAACSPDLRRVNWRTVLWGMGLQVGFALAVLRLWRGSPCGASG